MCFSDISGLTVEGISHQTWVVVAIDVTITISYLSNQNCTVSGRFVVKDKIGCLLGFDCDLELCS